MSSQDPGQIRKEGLQSLGAEIVGSISAYLQCGPEPRYVPFWPWGFAYAVTAIAAPFAL